MCRHEMHDGTCAWCEPRQRTFDEALEGMWAEAFSMDAPATPQVTATLVPVPTTARLPAKGKGLQLPRSDKPRHEVLVQRPHDPQYVRVLFDRLAQARPDWVR